MQTRIETITPAIAQRYLDTMRKNRNLRDHKVSAMVAAIVSGKFHLTHQGIGFHLDGSLVDGQHRLTAIVRSGVAVQMTVTRGLTDEALAHVDEIQPRTTADRFTMGGYEISKNLVAVVRAIWSAYALQQWGYAWSSAPSKCDEDVLLSFAQFHEKAVYFAADNGKVSAKGVTHACVRAAIAAAWYTQDRARLTSFKEHLAGGIINGPEDTAASRLREWLLTGVFTGGGSSQQQEVFLRASTALKLYLDGEPCKKLYMRQNSQFTLPVVETFQCTGSIMAGHLSVEPMQLGINKVSKARKQLV